ncbi:MAG: DUF4837 family protein [Winogradskyella sp.]|uniref:DUF4837 family protein n=1 Tax=Winogradskyella sp. TaxID=1883156 RepID=UPI001859481E|nr:DUF4837 family protein [Winogradskyella sp.]MBT8245435.1 DUF4837 family protein [Winogradskyella sp.]NNK22778.1 DUF4837 family protein [Winogradskyella sp.]
MKRLLSFFCLLLILSCNDKKDNVRYLTESSGNINSISVVVDNILWEDKVGEAVRRTLAAPAKGLPQDEPMFSLKQIPTPVFSGFATKSRIILKLEKTDSTGIVVKENVYAKPQTVVVVKGKTDQDIVDQITENSAKIIDAFTKREVFEKLRRINKSLLKDEAMENALGFTIDIPSAYRIAKSEDDFYWVRKSLTNSMTMDLVFYSYPLDSIRKNDSTVIDIVNMRDKMLAEGIPGEEDIIMKTEDAYSPSIYEAIIDNKKAFETRGVWEVEGAYMAGPFVNYAIEDKVNNRYLVAEGYVYAPSLDKREYVFELEAIIKSIKIK